MTKPIEETIDELEPAARVSRIRWNELNQSGDHVAILTFLHSDEPRKAEQYVPLFTRAQLVQLLTAERKRAEAAEALLKEMTTDYLRRHKDASDRFEIIMGLKSELKEAKAAEHLIHFAGIIEIAVRNPNVKSYMKEWEARAETAEARLKEAAEVIKPFAAFHQQAEGFVQARAEQGGSPILPTKHFSLSDFRAAAAWMKEHADGK